jgi:hypothetical protein
MGHPRMLPIGSAGSDSGTHACCGNRRWKSPNFVSAKHVHFIADVELGFLDRLRKGLPLLRPIIVNFRNESACTRTDLAFQPLSMA